MEGSAGEAYLALKTALFGRPILKLPEHDRRFLLRLDTSDVGVGAMLMQEHEGKPFLVGYASKKLSDRERKFSTIEECLAVAWVRKFMRFIYGVEYILQTDR